MGLDSEAEALQTRHDNGRARLALIGTTMLLTLTARHREGETCESFHFQPERPFNFEAGQYLRYTLPHHEPDNRGVSRFFTIASAPSEGFVMLTTRFSTSGSSFKQALSRLEEGAVVEAGGPSGRFVYADREMPAVFVAGGIGITPFRSILLDLASRQLAPNITLLYANSTPDIPFRRLFDDLASKQPALKIVYTVSQPDPDWRGPVGRIDERFITEHAPLGRRPCFYVSGPKAMVEATVETLRTIGVTADRVKQDFFPGYE
jgi:ferredoxin-NADP reductase